MLTHPEISRFLLRPCFLLPKYSRARGRSVDCELGLSSHQALLPWIGPGPSPCKAGPGPAEGAAAAAAHTSVSRELWRPMAVKDWALVMAPCWLRPRNLLMTGGMLALVLLSREVFWGEKLLVKGNGLAWRRRARWCASGLEIIHVNTWRERKLQDLLMWLMVLYVEGYQRANVKVEIVTTGISLR